MKSFLKSGEFEDLIRQDKFKLVEFVDYIEIAEFQKTRILFVKFPCSASQSAVPYDGYMWSRDRKNERRHQVTFGTMKLFGEDCQSIKCTDYTNNNIRKQVARYKGFVYSYYFTVHDEFRIHKPNEAPDFVSPRRAGKKDIAVLKSELLPFRSVKNAHELAREKGLALTRKQVQNAARSVPTTVVAKCGPKSRTTLDMTKELQSEYPDLIYTTDDSGLLSEFLLIQVFPDACRVYNRSCPTVHQYQEWVDFVESLVSEDRKERRRLLKAKLKESNSGIVFPSRIHVDTTFDLSDLYVTFVLGETSSFQTKKTCKPRAIPLGFMVHSSKQKENHQKFAEVLKRELDKQEDPLDPRKVPCVMLDGEIALEVYGEVLEARTLRCDVHLLSVLKHNHGGRAAADAAKPFIFGKMRGEKWCSGITGCFTIEKFVERLKCCKTDLHPKIYDWLWTNRFMLMESASALAKLRGGHILQFSTNNQNENFNAQVKTVINKKLHAHLLINHLTQFCKGKLKELWLSAIDGSEYVVMTQNIEAMTHERRLEAFENIGLPGSLVLAYDVPLRIAEKLDVDRLTAEENNLKNLLVLDSSNSHFLVKDGTSDRGYSTVIFEQNALQCTECKKTLPQFICQHVLSCLQLLTPEALDLHWKSVLRGRNPLHISTNRTEMPKPSEHQRRPKKNGLPSNCGSKPKNRFGKKYSSYNHVRKIAEVSSLSIFRHPGDSASTSTPSSSRRSPSPSASSTSFQQYRVLSPMFSSHDNTPVNHQLKTPDTSNNLSFSPSVTSTPKKRRSNREKRAGRRYSPSPQSHPYKRRSSGSTTVTTSSP